MKKSNLILILSKISESEFKRFGKFIDSPYFNSNKKLNSFYKILEEYYPEFDSLELSKENIYRKLYKEDEVVYGTIYYLISEMESLLEKFIGIEKIKPFTLDLNFLEELTKLGMHNYFDVKYKSVKKKLDGYPDEMHINNFTLSEIKRNNSIFKREFLTKKDLYRNEWTEPADELLKLFLKNSIRNILFLTNYNTLVIKDIKIPMLSETLDYIERNKIHESMLEFKVLYFEIMLLMYSENKYYNELKNILLKESKKLSQDVFKELIAILNNYNILTKIQGTENSEFYENENFELANIYLKNFSQNKNEVIPIDAYFSLFLTGSALGKFDWLKELQKKYIKRLEAKFQNNAECFGNAAIYFHDGQFDKALNSLSGIKNYSFLPYKTVVKVMQLKIYYELGLISEAVDAANSFQQFLRNDKLISANAKTVNSDFLKIYFKLLNLTGKDSLSKIENLQSEIKNHKRLLNSQFWFNAKLSNLEVRVSKKYKVG